MRYIIFLFLGFCFNANAQFQRSTDGVVQTTNNINYWQQDGSSNLSYNLGSTVIYNSNVFKARLGMQGTNSPLLWCNNSNSFADFRASTLALTNGSTYLGASDRTWNISNTYLTGNSHLLFSYWNGTSPTHGGSWWHDGNFTIGGAANPNALNNSGEKFQVKGTTKLGWDVMATTDKAFTWQTAGGYRAMYNSAANPNSLLTANQGDLASSVYGSTGFLFLKRSGTGNTGWSQVLSKDEPDGATLGQKLGWNGSSWVPETLVIQPADHANISGTGTEGFQPYWTGSTWVYSDKRQETYTVETGTGTVSASSNRKNTVINPGSTQAAMTINLHPAGTPSEGQQVTLTFVNEVTALTIQSNGAAAVLGAPTTTTAGRSYSFKFYATVGTNGTWILQQ